MKRFSITGKSRKICICAVSFVLMCAVIIGALCTGVPGSSLAADASAGVLTSVGGGQIIPEHYAGVNVPAGTRLMTPEGYSAGTYTTSRNGVAVFDFHIFAENFSTWAHTCGNIAVDHLGQTVLDITGVPEFGSRDNHDPLTVKLSYVNQPHSWNSSTNLEHMSLVLGEQNTVTVNGSQVSMNNNTILSNFASHAQKIFIDNAENGLFIDISAELSEAESYQRYLVWLMEEAKRTGTYTAAGGYSAVIDGESIRVFTYDQFKNWSSNTSGSEVDFSSWPEKTIFIDCDDKRWYEVIEGNQVTQSGYTSNANVFIFGDAKLRGLSGKRVIFNIDTTNTTDDSAMFYNTNVDADNIDAGEGAVHNDNNLLWSFYKRENGVPVSTEGIVRMRGGAWDGTVLAPQATVDCQSSLNGSIIARNVTTTNETHKSDYTGEKVKQTSGLVSLTLTKIWNDNPLNRPSTITVNLLRNDAVYTTVTIGVQDVTVADNGRTWYYTFENLEAADSSGKLYRYSVSEVVPDGYTAAIFNNTIINTGAGGRVDVYGSLSVGKVDTQGTLLPDAQLMLTGEGLDLSGAQITNADNATVTADAITWTSTSERAVITGLPLGSYTLTELAAPSGYKLSDRAMSVTLSTTSVQSVDFVNELLPETTASISGTKTLTGKTLEADMFEFELLDKDGQLVEKVSNGADGSFSFAPLTFNAAGEYTYSVREVNGGEIIDAVRYDDEVYTVRVNVTDTNGALTAAIRLNSGTANAITFENEAIVSGLTLSKKEFANGPELPGAWLELESVTGADLSTVVRPERAELEDGIITWLSTEEALTLGMMPDGEYRFTEITAPDGYEVAETIYVRVQAGKIYSVPGSEYREDGTTQWNTTDGTVTMLDAPTKLHFSKFDAVNGEELPGAVITLTVLDEVSLADVRVMTDAQHSVSERSVTWVSGDTQTTLERLPGALYLLEETTAPEGYEKTESVYVLVSGSDIYSGLTRDSLTLTNSETVIMTDDYNSLVLSKIDFGAGDELPGAQLTLEPITAQLDLSQIVIPGTDAEYVEEKNIIRWVSSDSPLRLRFLPDGEYRFTETAAPTGYAKAEYICIRISRGDVYCAPSDTAEPKYVLVTDDTVIMKDKANELVISKQALGGGPELPGARLTLEPVSGGANLSGLTLPENVSRNGDGIEWISGSEPIELVLVPDSVYKFTEITAPDGYEVAETIYVRVENGEVFCVQQSEYREDGSTDWGTDVEENTVIMFDAPVSDTPGDDTPGDDTPGDDTPGDDTPGDDTPGDDTPGDDTPGDDTPGDDTPDDDNPGDDTPGDDAQIPGNIRFIKLSNINKPLQGAQFSLTGSSGTPMIAVSDEHGAVNFANIAAGEYILSETGAPEDYQISTARITVTVTTSGTVTYTKEDGAVLDLLGVENLMKNNIIPVEDNRNLNIGDKVDLNSTLIGELEHLKDEQVTWESTDSSVINVDSSGKATVLGAGNATVYAYKDGVLVGTFVLGVADKKPTYFNPSTGGTAAIGAIIILAAACIVICRRRKNPAR